MAADLIDSGGGDAQGNQRGLEYDTVSDVYAGFPEGVGGIGSSDAKRGLHLPKTWPANTRLGRPGRLVPPPCAAVDPPSLRLHLSPFTRRSSITTSASGSL